ncbi:type II toxin-antitoxin system PemK/MazF family toxin [Marinivivus vitaminiproducens]|nr:type II toxin-antitoxin system PemK/MazF family toxin [Geminicoccaceae bacterium SCSIO 64248]
MIDKVMTVKRDRVGTPFGRLDRETMLSVNRALALFLGFA